MASSLASAGPILGMLLLGQPNSMLISFFYGLGLTIPVGFLLYFTCKFTVVDFFYSVFFKVVSSKSAIARIVITH